MSAQDLALAALRRIDPERAHRLAMAGLSLGLAGTDLAPTPALATTACGLAFANPIGLAAGFDKQAQAVRPLMRLGFGFVEIGTVTPRPQSGNPRPRLFRLPEERAAINRFGFNSDGIEAVCARLRRLRAGSRLPAPLGVNLGINKQDADPVRDYAALARACQPHADYLTVNLSSPNTPGLRDLQTAKRIGAILSAIGAVNRLPVLVKLAPDLADDDLPDLLAAIAEGGAAGLIVANTTIARPEGLRGVHAGETGGLSGRPLRERSCAMLALVARLAARRAETSSLTLIGAGGLSDAQDIITRVEAGAHLVQIYTAFAYDGPALLPRLKSDLATNLARRGIARLADLRGSAL